MNASDTLIRPEKLRSPAHKGTSAKKNSDQRLNIDGLGAQSKTINRALPPAKRASFLGMTADGKRHIFPTLLGMIRWAQRTNNVEALCMDLCCWRSYRSFAALQQQGCPTEIAYELAELYDGRPSVQSAVRTAKAA